MRPFVDRFDTYFLQPRLSRDLHLSELLDIGESVVVRALHGRIPDDVSQRKLFLDFGKVDDVNASDFEITTKVGERLASNYCHLVSG